MANIKTYSIQINGLQESVKAVDALNSSLAILEKRIKALEGKAVSVGSKTSGGGSKASSKSALSEEEKLEKQIAQIDEKRVAYSKEVYQNYLAAKDVLKETVKDQQSIAAAERLQAKTYSNTIAGKKQELADIKAAMQTVDLGDTAQIEKMAARANELNATLKKIEESYGQFGRNVGNYKSAFEGFTITVAGQDRTFKNATVAAKALKKELGTLTATEQANTEYAKALRQEYNRITSALNDATKSSKAMDEAMDMMQSFTAAASVGNGMKAFFGFDDNEIQKSIQRLVALQGVLQGIEKINQQIDAREGFGKWIAKSSDGIDTFVSKLFGAEKRMGFFIGQTKQASIAITAFSKVLKGLSAIGIVAALTAVGYAIQKIVELISDWVKGNADLVSSEQRLKAALDSTNIALERNLKLNQARYDANKINSVQKQIEDEKAYAAAIEKTNEEIRKRLTVDSKNSTFANATKNAGANSWADFLENDKGVTTLGGFTQAAKTIDELTKRYNALSDAVAKNTGLTYKNAKGIELCHLTAEDAKDELNHLEQFMAGQLVGTMQSFDLETENGRKDLQAFVNTIMESDDDLRKSILLRLPEIVSSEEGDLGEALRGWLSLIQQFAAQADAAMAGLNFEKYANSIIESADKTRKKYFDRQREELTAQYNALTKEEQAKQKERYEQALAANKKNADEAARQATSQLKSRYNKEAAEIEAGEKYKAELKIKLMNDGLAKVLRQLDEEERQELVKAKKYGADVTQVQQYYNKKRLEEQRKYADEVRRTYLQLYNDLRQLISENENLIFENTKKKIENYANLFKKSALKDLNYGGSRNYSNYGSVKDVSKRQPSTFDYEAVYTKEEIETAKKYLDMMNGLKRANIDLENLLKELPKDQEKWDEAQLHSYNVLKSKINYLEKETAALQKVRNAELGVALYDDAYSKNLSDAFLTRIREREKYYNRVNQIDETAYKKELDAQKKHLEELKKNEIEDAKQRYSSKNSQNVTDRIKELNKMGEEKNLFDTDEWKTEMENLYKEITVTGGKYFGENGELATALREGKLQIDEFFKLSLQEAQQYEEKLKNIDEKYNQERISLENQANQQILTANAEYYNNMIGEFQDFSQELNSRYGRQPVINNFRIVDVKKTARNLEEVKQGFINLMNELIKKKKELQVALDQNKIKFDDFKLAESQLNDLENRINEGLRGVEEKFKDLPGEFINSLNTYVQAGLQAIQTLITAFGEFQDYQFEKEQNEIDKENDILKDKLAKQEELINKHKSEVDSIEDELANSRGDRRQHLIDQLNAEVAAEREAAREKQRLQKDEEKLKKRQEQLEQDRRKAEYDRNVKQAFVSWHMAIANGLATQPFLPVGIAMGALATTLGAIQYALVKSQKPYARGGQLDGGVAQGPRHRDGGIPVLGGRASIEGGEFITNRQTTADNIALLEFINSKKKKIDVSDLIDFYSSGNIKKNITGIKTKFEDGGYVPVTPNIDVFDDGLRQSFERYSNRPVVVSVVDINNKQADVKRVQTLAGL